MYKKLLTGLLLFALFNSSDVFLLLKAKQSGLDDTMVIGVYIFYNLVFALLAYPIGKLTDRLGMMKTIITGLLIFSAVYFAIGFAESITLFLVIFLAYAIFAACFDSTTKALITENCKKENTGTALGFYNGCSSLLTILASSWTGFVWTHFNPRVAFIISALGVLLVVIFFLLNYKNIRTTPEIGQE